MEIGTPLLSGVVVGGELSTASESGGWGVRVFVCVLYLSFALI